MAILGFCLNAALILPVPTYAQFYQWTDRSGVLQFTDDLSEVPPEHREAAKKRRASQAEEGSTVNIITEGAQTEESPSSTNQITEEGYSQRREEESEARAAARSAEGSSESAPSFRDRLQKAKDELALAKRELDQVYVQRRETYSNKAGPGMQGRVAELAEQEVSLKERIDALEREIQEVIPEEARRQGVPPGDLR